LNRGIATRASSVCAGRSAIPGDQLVCSALPSTADRKRGQQAGHDTCCEAQQQQSGERYGSRVETPAVFCKPMITTSATAMSTTTIFVRVMK
jgi:hypothetical protein